MEKMITGITEVKRGGRDQNLEKLLTSFIDGQLYNYGDVKYTLKISKKIRLIQGFDFNCYWKIQKDRHKYF